MGLHAAKNKMGLKLQGFDATVFLKKQQKKVLEVLFQLFRYWLEKRLNNQELPQIQNLYNGGQFMNTLTRPDLINYLSMDQIYEGNINNGNSRSNSFQLFKLS